MKKNPLKFPVFALFIAGVAGAGYYFLLPPQPGPNKPASVSIASADKLFGWKFPVTKFPSTGSIADQIAFSSIRDPGGIPQGLPVRLQVPIIGVDSAIEDAVITPDGRMDVPAGSVNVAWFALGPHPGDVGSAVIGGHFGISNGVPFVFYNLDNITLGNKVYIVNDRGDTLAFQVRSIKLFNRDADATPVFTSSDGLAHLNLITCEGVWNQVNGTYPQRRVIFTDAIPSEGVAPASTFATPVPPAATTISAPVATSVFPRSFGIGASGADVAALQTALVQKGFLTMPPGAAKGFFGALTGAALAKYQTSTGLPPVGRFGPLTRAKLIAELGSRPVLPNTGIISVPPAPVTIGEIASSGAAPTSSIQNPSALPQIVIQTIKNLYATPLDGLVTSLLLISIAFMALKIIRRRKGTP
jgi:peptidoglycan hydrolase-like protein with peptidoglycan-binding domain